MLLPVALTLTLLITVQGFPQSLVTITIPETTSTTTETRSTTTASTTSTRSSTTTTRSTTTTTTTTLSPPLPPKISKLHINSEIQFRYANTEVVSQINNPNTDQATPATFTITIPDSAFISNFSMIIKEVEYVAEVKEKEAAKEQFDQAVSDGRGAGLVSQDTRDANQFSVSTNIEAAGKVIFKLTYGELLERKAGQYEHNINVNPGQVIDNFKIEVLINESLPLSSLSVPELLESNEIDFEEDRENEIAVIERNIDNNEKTARIVFEPDRNYQEEAGDQGISGQFRVRYDVDRKGQDSEVQVIDGYFVHYFVPENLETLPKYVVFVLDVSGSMSGEKINQLKDSMFTVLDDMTDKDYFDIISFSFDVNLWTQDDNSSENFFQATEENKNAAIKYVISLSAGGGTNINDAMLKGLELAEQAVTEEKLPSDVKSMIVFLTDGEPTEGETDPTQIRTNIKEANSNLDLPIFCIGFGRGADFTLLQKIAQDADSLAKMIYEDSDAALQLENFYSEIASPLVSNLRVEYVGGLVQNSSVSDNQLKTLFRGGEFVVAGKLEEEPESGILTVNVIGDVKDGEYVRRIDICLRNYAESANTTDSSNTTDSVESSESLSVLPGVLPLPDRCLPPPSFPPRSQAQQFLQKLHAFLNIKQLIKKIDAASSTTNTTEDKEKALNLALQNNFVTSLTSLVVTRPDQEPELASLTPVSEPGFRDPIFQSFSVRTHSVPNRFSSTAFMAGGFSGHNRLAALAPRPLTTTPAYYSVIQPLSFSLNSAQYDAAYAYDDYEEEATLALTEHEEPTTLDPVCSIGNLTLHSKTYFRGSSVILSSDTPRLSEHQFTDQGVSASLTGSCCWEIFSEEEFMGNKVVLHPGQEYKGVKSLGELFRDAESARRVRC